MNPLDAITLTAFLFALTQLDSPLPEDVKTQLQNFAKDSSPDFGKFHAIAKIYPELNQHYQNIREILQSDVGERSKGPLPNVNHLKESELTEIANIAREVAQSPEPISLARQKTLKLNFFQQLREHLEIWRTQ